VKAKDLLLDPARLQRFDNKGGWDDGFRREDHWITWQELDMQMEEKEKKAERDEAEARKPKWLREHEEADERI